MRYALRFTCCVNVLIFFAPAVSIAEPEATGEKTILELGDVDKDGALSLAELRGVVPHATDRLFERLDTDGDGRLSTKDWNWNVSRLRVRNDFPQLFRADADTDNQVTFAEATLRYKRMSPSEFIRLNAEATLRYKRMTPSEFVRLDADSDGAITRGEYSNTLRRPQGDAIRRIIDEFLLADLDGDGRATWEEIRAQAPEYPRAVFDWLDRNADDAIGESDYRKPLRDP